MLTGNEPAPGGGGRALVALSLAALIALSLLLPLAGCGGSRENGGVSGTVQAEVVSGPLPERIDRLAFKLLKQVTVEEAGGNVFLSPASLEMALAMTMNGAAGDTLAAMAGALELQGMTTTEVNRANKAMADWLARLDPKVTLEIANSLWAREGVEFSPGFLAANREYYDARVETIDLDAPSAANTINGWVSEQTHGKIDEIVKPPIDPLTILFLLNAIYFKGQWTTQFDKGLTTDGDFKTSGGTDKVPMMTQSGEFSYMENEGFQAIFLPYGAGKTGMYIFLPAESSSLPAFIEGLTPENWTRWMSEFAEHEGDITMPRFKLEYEKALKDTLSAMGMGVAFTEQADFSKMLVEGSTDEPFIQQVKQKTYADVNEEGTEAAAVTSVEVGVTSIAPGERFIMTVDRPFFFAITDDAGKVILFEGALYKP
ncbi:MAG: serpin family protein [Actinobacteria bacterium]|nr:serpin family protein [Actinomycetota bacterium]